MMTALSASLIIGNFEIFEKIFNLVGIEHFQECKIYDYSSQSQTYGEFSALDYILEKTKIMHDSKQNNH